jgi:hypothetical protein
MAGSNTAENALLQFEAGQTLQNYEAFTDAGDQKEFSGTTTIWSNKAGFTPVIRPDGVITGGEVIPEVGLTNDQVDVAALTAYLAGVQTSVSAAAGTACTRATTASFFLINSITVNSGGSIAVVAGTEGAAISETRAAAGGPPLIPVGSIEVAQVRLEGNVAGPVVADEIFDVAGQHQERWDFPIWDESLAEGKVNFQTALPKIHTGVIPKGVYGKTYQPIFQDIPLASDYVPSANTHSVGSTQVYRATIGSVSSSLGQGGVTVFLKDGISDAIISEQDEYIWMKFFPDENKTPYILDNGKLGIAVTYPAGDSIQGACTLSAQEEASKFVV